MKLPTKADGDVIIDGPDGTQAVLRKSLTGRDWVLKKIGVTHHCRFGNAKQIRQDIKQFQLTGYLPVSSYGF